MMIIFGASGHGKVILDILFNNNISVAKIYDDNPRIDTLFNIPVTKTDTSKENYRAIIAIGNNKVRKEFAKKYAVEYTSAFHPDASISMFAEIGMGTVVMAQACVNAAAIIGKHCIVNSCAVVEHDCSVEDFVHVGPNACLGGNVHIGEGTHIGMGASIMHGVTVGKWCEISAGSVVNTNLSDFSIV